MKKMKKENLKERTMMTIGNNNRKNRYEEFLA